MIKFVDYDPFTHRYEDLEPVLKYSFTVFENSESELIYKSGSKFLNFFVPMVQYRKMRTKFKNATLKIFSSGGKKLYNLGKGYTKDLMGCFIFSITFFVYGEDIVYEVYFEDLRRNLDTFKLFMLSEEWKAQMVNVFRKTLEGK